MISSGTTAIATSGAGAVTAAAATLTTIRRLTIINEGSEAGFFLIEGTTWCRLPATSTVNLEPNAALPVGVQVKRQASTNLSGVYVFGY